MAVMPAKAETRRGLFCTAPAIREDSDPNRDGTPEKTTSESIKSLGFTKREKVSWQLCGRGYIRVPEWPRPRGIPKWKIQ